MRVYISGKIGEEEVSAVTFEKFAEAERLLVVKGWTVFNPVTSQFKAYAVRYVASYNDGIEGIYRPRKVYDQLLLMDLNALCNCDAICLLPDWRQSPGAKVELAYAQAIGLKIYELSQYQTLIEWK